MKNDGLYGHKATPLRARKKRITQDLFLDWLQEYMATGFFGAACKRVRISRPSMYRALKQHLDWAEAKSQADEVINGDLTDEAIRRAVDGYERPIYQQGLKVGTETVYSDRLLEILLRTRMPEKYSEKKQTKEGAGMVVNFIIEGVHRNPPRAKLTAAKAQPIDITAEVNKGETSTLNGT